MLWGLKHAHRQTSSRRRPGFLLRGWHPASLTAEPRERRRRTNNSGQRCRATQPSSRNSRYRAVRRANRERAGMLGHCRVLLACATAELLNRSANRQARRICFRNSGATALNDAGRFSLRGARRLRGVDDHGHDPFSLGKRQRRGITQRVFTRRKSTEGRPRERPRADYPVISARRRLRLRRFRRGAQETG